MKAPEKLFSPKTTAISFAIFLAIYFAGFLLLVLWKYWGNLSSLMDLGHFSQTIWAFSETGKPLTNLVYPYELTNRLGFHFSPVIYLLTLDYLLLGPIGLILAHVFFITAISLIIFRIARQLGQSQNLSLVWALIYLVNPFVINSFHWEFMEVSIGGFLIALAYLALFQKNRLMFLLTLVLMLGVKEHFGLICAMLALVWGKYHKDWKFSIPLAAIFFTSFIFILCWLMPSLLGTSEHVMLSDNVENLSRYSWIMNLDIKQFLANKNLTLLFIYLPLLLVPLLLLPLRVAFFALPALPDLLANTLSLTNLPIFIGSYHSLQIVIIFIICSIFASRNINSKNLVGGILLLTLAMNAATTNPLWQPKKLVNWPDPEVKKIQALIKPEAKLCAQMNIGSHFAERLYIYPYPEKLDSCSTVVLNTNINSDSEYFKTEQLRNLDYQAEKQKMMNDKNFYLIYSTANWYVFKRK